MTCLPRDPRKQISFLFLRSLVPVGAMAHTCGSVGRQRAQMRASERTTKQLTCWSSIYSLSHQTDRNVLHTSGMSHLQVLSAVRRNETSSPGHRTNQLLREPGAGGRGKGWEAAATSTVRSTLRGAPLDGMETGSRGGGSGSVVARDRRVPPRVS